MKISERSDRKNKGLAQLERLLALAWAVQNINPYATEHWLNSYSPRPESKEWSKMLEALSALREHGDI